MRARDSSPFCSNERLVHSVVPGSENQPLKLRGAGSASDFCLARKAQLVFPIDLFGWNRRDETPACVLSTGLPGIVEISVLVPLRGYTCGSSTK